MPLPKVFKTREFHASLLGVVAIATLAMNIIAFSYDEEFTKFLYGDGIDFDAPDAQKARAEATVFAKQIEEESIVLLKNDRSTLPFQSPKLNVFGYGSSDHGFVHQGGGSGKTSEYARRSFYDSLKDAGVELNPTLVSFYNSFNYSRYGDATIASLQFRNYEPDPSVYSQDFFARAKEFSPNAAIVFSRPATEKLDIPSVAYDRYGAMDETRNSLALTDNEQFLLDSVASNFSNVVVILNSGSPMELSFADDNGIPSILNVGYPGNTGCEAIGEILLGRVNPSGRTTDTFVYDSRSNPAYFNCGDLGNHGFSNSMRYVDYAESVYVGYRYYETLYEESGKDERSYWKTVAFPFGHGLSYTEFEWTLLDTTFLDETGAQRIAQSGMEVNQNGSLSFQVWAENVGKQAGRDVVEIYANPPYYEGEIEKSAANLVSFAKTSLLEPGKGELLSLTIPLRRLASYDAFDANDNGFVGYELEGGRYRLSLRHNAHEDHPLRNRDSSSFDFDLIGEGIHYATDEETGAQVSNLFTTMHNERSGANSQIQETQSPNALSIDGGADQGIRYLTRSDLKGTFPKATRDRAATKAITDTYYVLDPRMEEVSEPAFGTKEIQDITQAFDKPYDDEVYEKLTRSATKAELANLVAHAGFGTPAVDSIQKPRCLDLDGPSGINTTVLSSSPGNAASYPCPSSLAQSWSMELCYGFGQSVAAEAVSLGVNGWYAPATNIHRSPLGGRNFEYYSEDPLLSGKCAAYVIRGAKDGGVYAYVKHFAADENESGTNGQYHFLTEQALREIYAKPFEIAVKEGKANAMMLSKNRIGYVRAAGSSALLQGLLRKEWGFQGAVITDYYVGGNAMDADEAIRAGVDLILEGEPVVFDDSSSPTFYHHIARAAKNVLYCYCDTMASANKAQSLPFDHHTGAKNDIRPIWKPVLLVIDAILAPGLVVYGIFIFRKLKPGTMPE